MNTKLVSVFVVIVVLAALTRALPVEESKQLETFLANVNGSACYPTRPESTSNYNTCSSVCVNKNGVQSCFKKCTYAADDSLLDINYKTVEETKDIDSFLGEVNGAICYSRGQAGIASYDTCFWICVNKNGVQSCFKKCNYAAQKPSETTNYAAKCQMKYICIKINGQQHCSWNCI